MPERILTRVYEPYNKEGAHIVTFVYYSGEIPLFLYSRSPNEISHDALDYFAKKEALVPDDFEALAGGIVCSGKFNRYSRDFPGEIPQVDLEAFIKLINRDE